MRAGPDRTLLRLAEELSLYRPLWSEEILAEVRQTLLREPFRLSAQKAEYRLHCMNAAFPQALVTGYEKLISGIDIPAKHDRHVVAAAIRGGATAICTANTRHFPRRALGRYGIEVLTRDQFLVRAFRFNALWVLEKLTQQARSRAMDLDALMDILGKAAPRFAAAVRTASAL